MCQKRLGFRLLSVNIRTIIEETVVEFFRTIFLLGSNVLGEKKKKKSFKL